MLFENENIVIPYAVLHRVLSNVGFTSPKRQKLKHKDNLHPTRPRRERFGELVQIDGSIHLWFGESKFTLHAAIDDATSMIVGAFFDKEETLYSYYRMLQQILIKYGIPQEFYADRRTIFEYQSLKKPTIEKDTFTQFQRCCNQLGVEIHTTSVSQAKGRVERLFNTLQDRLISEMRLAGVSSVEEANAFLDSYVPRHNARFALPVDYDSSAFVQAPTADELDYYLSVEFSRISDNGSSISVENNHLQVIDGHGLVLPLPSKTKVKIYKTLDGRYVCIHNHAFYTTIVSTYKKETVSKPLKERKNYVPPPNHPWRRFVIN